MIQTSPIRPLDPDSIVAAAETLKAGGLVAFPTETVYGLGADATNDLAVARIFETKGRPRFNPLIVHLPDLERAGTVALFDNRADALGRKFWPGALTLVLARNPDTKLSKLTSAGLPTVAVRVPAHDGARMLLKEVAHPIAAPSANRSGRISPTTARHVGDEFGDEIAVILDGGPCQIGVESTVVDLCGEAPILLRPGGVPVEALEEALGRTLSVATDDAGKPRAPGMAGPHYRPSLPIRLDATAALPGEALLGFGPSDTATLNLSASADLREAAANLFSHLHTLDNKSYSGIAVMPVPDRGLGRAINDRLLRAAAP